MTAADMGTGGLTPAGPYGGPATPGGVGGSAAGTSRQPEVTEVVPAVVLSRASRREQATALSRGMSRRLRAVRLPRSPVTRPAPRLPRWVELRRLALGLVALGSALALVAVGMSFQRFLDRPPVLAASASSDPHAGDLIDSLDSSGAGGSRAGSSGPRRSKDAPLTAGATIPGAKPPSLVAAEPDAAAAVAIHIPRMRLNRSLVQLHEQPDRSLSVPKSFADVGWWSEGPRPGAAGATIIAGHVSSKAGPAVFWTLQDLRVGDQITVDRADHTSAVFQVVGKASYPRSSFPDDVVYRTSGKPSIHLVTCDGVFDTAIGHHDNNLVVFADLVSSTPKPGTHKSSNGHKSSTGHKSSSRHKSSTGHQSSTGHHGSTRKHSPTAGPSSAPRQAAPAAPQQSGRSLVCTTDIVCTPIAASAASRDHVKRGG